MHPVLRCLVVVANIWTAGFGGSAVRRLSHVFFETDCITTGTGQGKS